MSCNRRKPTFADPPVLSANEPKADIPWPRPTDKISLQTLSVARMTPFATKTYQSVDLFSEQLIERGTVPGESCAPLRAKYRNSTSRSSMDRRF
jgi:hypothetical protein